MRIDIEVANGQEELASRPSTMAAVLGSREGLGVQLLLEPREEREMMKQKTVRKEGDAMRAILSVCRCFLAKLLRRSEKEGG